MVWTYFALIQLVNLLATLLGYVVLVPACLCSAWMRDAKSIKDGRDIDRWTWPLNAVYGNPEDGVSGATALVNKDGATVPYLPDAWPPWRAYCWSAWRNSCDNLKYVFAWANGPLVEKQIFGRAIKFGWQPENGKNVPVLSIR